MSPSLEFPEAVPKLTCDRLSLRELTESDVPGWFARAIDAESADLAGDPIPESIAMGTVWLERHRERFRQRAAIRWAIVEKATSDSLGTIGLTILPHDHRIADLGIVIGRAAWNQGIGTAATKLVLDYAFSRLGLAEVQAEVLQRNLASIRLFEKVGFRRLGMPPRDEQSPCEADACFLYVLSNPDFSAAYSRSLG